MAVSYLRLKNSSALVFCLSSDTKPTAVDGYLLHETDTGATYYVSGAAWVLYSVPGGAAWGAITGTLSSQTDLNTALNGKEPLKGSDDNYVTDAEKIVIGNTSGTNTGDNATNTQYSGLAASKLNTTAFDGLAKITVGTTTPVGPAVGDLWVDLN